MPKILHLEGQRFGRLTVQSLSNEPRKTTHRKWICRCDCGNTTTVISSHLIANHTTSCGCYARALRRTSKLKHGQAGGRGKSNQRTVEYNCWIAIHQRCQDPNHISFKYYGALGIIVCERWNTFTTFLTDMKQRPTSKHSIDRINPYGNYEPSNCRWATKKEQAINRRKR